MPWGSSDGRWIHDPRYFTGIKEFRWLGWRASPEDLFRNGWDIAFQEVKDPRTWFTETRIGVRNDAIGASGLSFFRESDVYRFMEDTQARTHKASSMYHMPPVLPLGMTLGKDVYFQDSPMFTPWAPIDPEEEYMNSQHPYVGADILRYRGLREVKLFKEMADWRKRTSTDGSPKLLLEQATLSDVLDYALKLQKPVDDALRMERLQRSRMAAELRLIA